MTIDENAKEKAAAVLKADADETHRTFAWPIACLLPILSLTILFFIAEERARERRLQKFPVFGATLNQRLKRPDCTAYTIDDLGPSAYRHLVLIHLRSVEAGLLPGDYERLMAAMAKELNWKARDEPDLSKIDLMNFKEYLENLPRNAPPGGRQNLGGGSRN